MQRDRPLSEEKWLGMFPWQMSGWTEEWSAVLGFSWQQLGATGGHREYSRIYSVLYSIKKYSLILANEKLDKGMARCLWIHLKAKLQRWLSGIFNMIFF